MQVLRSDLRGVQSPVLAAVGPMQFEVVQARMASEYNAPVVLERLDYSVARVVRREGHLAVGLRGTELLTRSDGTHLLLFPDKWRVHTVERDHPELELTALTAGPLGSRPALPVRAVWSTGLSAPVLRAAPGQHAPLLDSSWCADPPPPLPELCRPPLPPPASTDGPSPHPRPSGPVAT